LTEYLLHFSHLLSNGRSGQLLRELGFKVIHEKRDFYKDIEQDRVPRHDVLITNPPYSDKHKRQCLDYCLRGLRVKNKPFLILMPQYVAARQYYRDLHPDDVVYLIPNERYQYDHPEGTGKEESPFDSLWFCGVGKDHIESIRKYWNKDTKRPRMAASLEELEQLGAISTQNRPGARQRKRKKRKTVVENVSLGVILQRSTVPPHPKAKKRKKQHPDDSPSFANVSLGVSVHRVPSGTGVNPETNKHRNESPSLFAHRVTLQRTQDSPPKNPTKKSKYRDGSGKRTRKRF